MTKKKTQELLPWRVKLLDNGQKLGETNADTNTCREK